MLNKESFFEEITKVSFFSPSSIQDFFEKEKINFDEIQTDLCGNLHFLKKGNGEKVQILFRYTPYGIMCNPEEENQRITILGGEGEDAFFKDRLILHHGEAVGVLRQSEDKTWKLENFIDFKETNVEIFDIKNQTICKGDKLYSLNMSSIIPLYFAFLLSEPLCDNDKYIDFTLWNEAVSGVSGAICACNYADPESIFYLSMVKEQKGCQVGEGPSVVLKDGNFVLSGELRDAYCQNTKTQFFVSKTDSIMEQLDIHAGGKPLLGIYLPILHAKTNFEEIIWKDVEKTRDLLLKYLR